MNTTATRSFPAWLPLASRLLLAAIFIASGLGKLAEPAATQAYIASVGAPLPLAAYAVAVLVELGGGVMLLLGYRTRLAALVLAAFTVVAGVLFHNNFADQIQMIMFMKNLAIAGGLLHVVAFGAGGFSVDQRRTVPARVRTA